MECDALKHDTGEGSGPISLEPFGYYLEVILRVLFGGHSEELSGDPVHLDIGVWGPFGPLKGLVFCANRLLLGTVLGGSRSASEASRIIPVTLVIAESRLVK